MGDFVPSYDAYDYRETEVVPRTVVALGYRRSNPEPGMLYVPRSLMQEKAKHKCSRPTSTIFQGKQAVLGPHDLGPAWLCLHLPTRPGRAETVETLLETNILLHRSCDTGAAFGYRNDDYSTSWKDYI